MENGSQRALSTVLPAAACELSGSVFLSPLRLRESERIYGELGVCLGAAEVSVLLELLRLLPTVRYQTAAGGRPGEASGVLLSSD